MHPKVSKEKKSQTSTFIISENDKGMEKNMIYTMTNTVFDISNV